MEMTQKQFIKLKSKGIKQATTKGACEDRLKRAIDAQTWSEMKNVIIDNIWWCIDNNIALPDGHYKNNEREFTVVDGKVHGEFVSYHDNGQVHVKCNYKKGKLHGDYVSHWPDGQIHVKCAYVKGERHGEYVIYLNVKCAYYNGEIVEHLA